MTAKGKRNGKLRVLVVGVGNMGASHARAYDEIDGFELAGLCARHIAKRTDLPERWSNVPRFASYGDALGTLKPDVVSINTWPDTHADYAIRTWKRNSAESPKGFVRTTVELPPGTGADRIAEIGFECLVLDKAADSPCGVEAVTKAFLLDRDYVPGPNVWTLTTPIAIPAGAIWTSALR